MNRIFILCVVPVMALSLVSQAVQADDGRVAAEAMAEQLFARPNKQ